MKFEPNMESKLGLPTGGNAPKIKNVYKWAIESTVNDLPEKIKPVKVFLNNSAIDNDFEDDLPF